MHLFYQTRPVQNLTDSQLHDIVFHIFKFSRFLIDLYIVLLDSFVKINEIVLSWQDLREHVKLVYRTLFLIKNRVFQLIDHSRHFANEFFLIIINAEKSKYYFKSVGANIIRVTD